MRDRFVGVIEGIIGRQVIGFMSGNRQNPDLMCEVFILGPSDLVDDGEGQSKNSDEPVASAGGSGLSS